jgi:hypothetical protein
MHKICIEQFVIPLLTLFHADSIGFLAKLLKFYSTIVG